MLNNIDVLELFTYCIDHEVAFDVFDTALLELIVEQPLHLFILGGVPTRLVIYHNDGEEHQILVLLTFKESRYDLLQLLVLHVGKVQLEL